MLNAGLFIKYTICYILGIFMRKSRQKGQWKVSPTTSQKTCMWTRKNINILSNTKETCPRSATRFGVQEREKRKMLNLVQMTSWRRRLNDALNALLTFFSCLRRQTKKDKGDYHVKLITNMFSRSSYKYQQRLVQDI